MVKTRQHLIRAIMAVSLLSTGTASANVITDYTWDGPAQDWTAEYGDVNLSHPGSGGNPDGWLTITFPETTAPEILEDEWSDVIMIDASDFFVGNWTPNMFVSFDFWASNAIPKNLQLQFHSTNENVWGYNVTDRVTSTQVWTTVQVGLGYENAWGPLTGFDDTEEQFLADLASIDWIGVYIFRDSNEPEVYGLDNFSLLIPEPGEWAMLAAVLAAAMMGGRRREDELQPSPS
jgi:hypothetical protein